MDDLDDGFNKSRARAKQKTEKRSVRRTEKLHRANVEFVPSIDFEASMDRAQDAYRAGVEQIEALFAGRTKRIGKRRMTKKALTEKVRTEIAEGKRPKGTLKKEVDRRWKRNQQAHIRQEKKIEQEKTEALEKLQRETFPSGEPSPKFYVPQAVWMYHVEAEVELSDDVRVINVSFKANAGDDIEALVFLACVDYFQTDDINLLGYVVVGQSPAEDGE